MRERLFTTEHTENTEEDRNQVEERMSHVFDLVPVFFRYLSFSADLFRWPASNLARRKAPEYAGASLIGLPSVDHQRGVSL